MASFEDFSQQAKDLIARTYDIVQRYKINTVDTSELLLALVEQTDTAAIFTLKRMGVDIFKMQEKLDEIIISTSKYRSLKGDKDEQLFMTPRSKQVIDLSVEGAKNLQDEFISTEHILLAILSEQNTEISKLMVANHLNRNSVEKNIKNLREEDIKRKIDIEKSVFISYRRTTSMYLARSIFMDLQAHGYNVFLDVNTIDNGAFDQIILNQIAARPHFIILLSQGCLERCESSNDWLRREIEEAIRLKRNIVPIIEEKFNAEKEFNYLPEEWRDKFARYNGVRLLHDYFEAGMDKLRTRFLKQPLDGMLVPVSKEEQEIVRLRMEHTNKTIQSNTEN